jgi:hypothetical protein
MVTSIGDYAFDWCSGLTRVTIPEGVTSIGGATFFGCGRLTSITIPASVTSIGNSAFYGCYELTSINVDANNSIYCDIAGILYNRNQTELVVCPAGLTGIINIPEGVTSIGSNAFRDCSGLISITIPEGVTSIGNNAFDGCSGLTIYGYDPSAAKTYASENNITFIAVEP